MNKLGERNYLLLSEAVKMTGTFNPSEILPAFIEQAYIHEAEELTDFLQWLHDTGKTFGSGNYETIFHEFKQATL